MLFDLGMENEDDEPTRWTSIGWQALLITNRLRNAAQLVKLNKSDSDSGADSEHSAEREKRALEQREFVERRLREIRRFEDRAAGKRRK